MNEKMLVKLQKARTVEEIIATAKEYGEEVTAEKAQELLDPFGGAAGELSDDALAAVAGGIVDTTKSLGGNMKSDEDRRVGIVDTIRSRVGAFFNK